MLPSQSGCSFDYASGLVRSAIASVIKRKDLNQQELKRVASADMGLGGTELETFNKFSLNC